MTRSLPDTSRLDGDGDLLTVEAPTAADAVAQVHEQLGPDARIVQASKVLRGGMWGFFPKEVVQLQAHLGDRALPEEGVQRQDTESAEGEAIVPKRSAADWSARDAAVTEQAAAPHPAQPQPSPPQPPAPLTTVSQSAASAPEAAPEGLAGVLAQLAAAEDDQEAGLGAALRRHLGVTLDEEEPVPARSTGNRSPRPRVLHAGRSEAVQDAVPATMERVGMTADGDPIAPGRGLATPGGGSPATVSLGSVMGVEEAGPWSARALLHLGLSRGLVETVVEQRPHDDASWTYALARALGPLCRPLPAGPSLLVGPRAGALANRLPVPVIDEHEPAVGELDRCATSIQEPEAWPSWLQTSSRGSRWLHLVVGGRGWRALLGVDPLAVSWMGEDNLGPAVCTAHELGMVLGVGVHGRRLITPTPIELSMVVRDLLGGAR
jgi:hypothetical protein